MVMVAPAVARVAAPAEQAPRVSMERQAVPGPMARQPQMVVAAVVVVVPAVVRAVPAAMVVVAQPGVPVAAQEQPGPMARLLLVLVAVVEAAAVVGQTEMEPGLRACPEGV